MDEVLHVEGLKTYFFTENYTIPAVNDVSFSVNKGELVGIVGESGSGKSVTALSIMGLIEEPGRILDGKIIYNGQNLIDLPEKQMRKFRGNEIAMIFQEPLKALNPVLTIGKQISEAIRIHQHVSKREAKKKSIELLERVKIPRAKKIYTSYPHQLSGGMRQRVMIAIALSCQPNVLIADEPTTALDVTIQAQILKLLEELSEDLDVAIILITHDLGVIAEMVDRVIVMYGGTVVEEADVMDLFKYPKHPYTKGLIDSTPQIYHNRSKLHFIQGYVPRPDQMPKGCKFHPRCHFAMEKCRQNDPPLTLIDDQYVRCWLYENNR